MSKNNRTIRMLLTGLTMGDRVFEAGDLIPEREATHSLKTLADGKLHVGKRWAEWIKEPDQAADAPPVETPEEPVEPDPEPDQAADAPPPTDLAEAIKQLVREGKTKTAIVKQLGEPEDVSQRAVSDQFDMMLAVGVIISGDTPGSYTVSE